MKSIKTLPDIIKFCATIGNLPTSYMQSLTYEEQLLWLLNFLNETLLPTMHETINSIEELENWFNNLDVQEEVNNKLEEMAQSGELEEIISQYLNSTAMFCFDTVEDMKSATNLINGSYAKTLGYHNLNDTGGATYKIRNVNSGDNVDESFIIRINDNLVAELIIEDIIEVNKLGADNTGTNDSSEIINNALSKINDLWLEGSKINTIVFNGIYKLDYQVEIPPCAKLRSNGLVKFISNVNNDSTFFIHYLSNDLPETDTEKQRYLSGDLINFESGAILVHSGNRETNGAIGIEIGDKSNLGSDYSISKYMIRNLTITNFDTAILHNSYNVYMGNYENVLMELNKTCVKFGLSSQIATFSNSGERMSFSNCLFGTSGKAVDFESINWSVFFDNCSFDFDVTVFYQPSNSQYWNRINVTTSHFEAFTSLIEGFTDNEEFININNSIIFNSTISNQVFKNSSNTKISIKDSEFYTTYSDSIKASDYVLFGQKTYQKNTRPLRSVLPVQYIHEDNLLNNFDSLTDGEITSTPNSYIGMFKVIERYGISSSSIVTDNEFYTGHKSLVLTKASADSSMILQTDLLPLKGEELIMSGIITKNMKNRQMRCMVSYYDKDENKIHEKTSYEWYPTTINNDEWVINPRSNFDTVPANAAYYKITITLPSMGSSDPNSTQYYIGGIISNSR